MGSVDFVIVGAGSAGSVLAERLSADPAIRVVLIEAGPGWRHPLSTMPRGWIKLTSHPKRAWAFPVEHEPGRPEPELWARGRGLGGSSAINGMVYVRGAPQDYDGWGRFGVTGWDWATMERAFRANEHATGGPLQTSLRPLADPLRSAVIGAGLSLGLEERGVLCDAGRDAVGCYAHSVGHDGRRMSAARAFLAPARKRPNLTVLSDARASRIVMEGGRAIGVDYLHKGRPARVLAGEVIVSCGALQSPQLLQVSGIGPAAVLDAAGVERIAHLPGVGENLAEHLVIALPHRLRGFPSHNSRLRGTGLLRELARYYVSGTGVMSYGASEMGAFVRSSPQAEWPDIQISLSPYTFARGLLPGRLQLEAEPGLTVIGYALRPESRGTVAIRTGNVADHPRIIPRWLHTPGDRGLAVGMIRALRRFAAAPPLQPFLETELWPGAEMAEDEALLSAFRGRFVSGLHAVGTCRMGDDDMAVVDGDLRVRGVAGLRVVDASVMPAPVSGNTNGPVMALARVAAERIIGGRG